MSITKIAIEYRVVTFVALLVIAVAGIQAYYSLPRAEDPGFTIRVAQIRTFFPGASPERVEQLITDKLEKVIQEMPEIDNITSTSKTGVSIIMVEIQSSYMNMRPIWDNLRRKVERAKTELPDEVRGPFVDDEFGDVFGTIVSVTGDGYTYADLKDIAEDCRNELLLHPDIAKVDIYGIQDERIFVEYNNSRLAELGLSPAQLSQILVARNIIIPGGEIFTADEQITLEPTGNFDTVEDLRQTLITLPGSDEVVYLGDVVHIKRGYVDPPASLARYNGAPCLALAINLREGGNIIELGEEVKRQVEMFKQIYPIGVEFNFVSFQPYFVSKKIADFTNSLLQSIVIVLLIMLAFLGFRSGLVVASLIPMSMIMSLLIMRVFNIGLNQMSLASLIIALGMLVDNAIVMSESIMVSMGNGQDPKTAAIESARELSVPLLTSSITTSAAFLPIFLAESDVGEYTAPLFLVVSIALLCSWVLSLTMTPMLCAKYLKVPKTASAAPFNSVIYRTYRNLLIASLKHRGLTILGTIGLFALAIVGMQFVPAIFFPPNNKPIMQAELRMPLGTPIEKTREVTAAIEAFMTEEMQVDSMTGLAGFKNWISFVGAGAPRFYLSYSPEPPSPEYAFILINATSYDDIRNVLIPRLENYIQENFPELTPKIRSLSLGPPVEYPIAIRISGRETQELFSIVERVKKRLSDFPGTHSVTDDWGQRTKKLLVRVNQSRAQRAGLTNRDIAISLQTVLSGISTTEYREDDEVIPITLRSVAADRHDIGKLESHNIYVQATGRSVPLKEVADIELVWQPSKVLRRDRLKSVQVQAQITQGQNAISMTTEFDKWLSEESKSWPTGYRYDYGGEIESSSEGNSSIQAKLPIAFLVIVLVLVAQFNSIRKPLIILLTIPLGLIGAVAGLLITGSYFGFMTLLGIISLAGIVINNGIVLLDRIRIETEDNGLPAPLAIVEACQLRLRPIFLTVATTIGGLIPLWYGDDIMFHPMAIAIMFGLAFATILTLGFVPVMYSLMFRVSFKDFKYVK